uniref:BTB domain-containing protein n=1 Tax=Panagrolaimus sp. JU765 TaxID=591449 RepID=A0AC34QQT5_9BILA
MVAVIHNFGFVYYERDHNVLSFMVKVDDYEVNVNSSITEMKNWKISVDCPVPVSIIFTLNLPTRTLIYEKNILLPKFMDQVLCVGATHRGGIFGTFKVWRKVSLNPFHDGSLDINDFGNFLIIAENQEIKVSKDLLKIYSPVFAAMFETDCIEAKENKVEIKDFTLDVVKIVVKILYSGTIPSGSTFEMMQEVCRFADKYNMKIFWDILQQWFDDYLTFYNVCQVANVASTYNFPTVIDKCVSIFTDNLKDAHKLDDLDKLNSVELLICVLKKYGSS